jgi:desulfoferrodoxin (superoxide reductase-like protein)
VSNRQAKFREGNRDQVFPWIFEFRNAQIQPAYLCPSNVIEDHILCLNDEEQVKFEINELQKKGPIYSKKKPRKYKGKENSHVPSAFQSIKNREIVTRVEHGMSGDHFIEYIYLRDKKTKEIVAFKKFSKEMASDTNTQEATLTFTPLPNTSGRVIPYAYCNKHGLWRGGAVSYL